jgi:hypothetical protein
MGRMSDLDIERQERMDDDGSWGGPDDGAAMMELERQEQHENRVILLTKALAYTIRGVEQATDPDVHLSLRAAVLSFHLTDFERQVVRRAYDLDCHHAGQGDRKALVEQAHDEIEQELLD